MAGACRRISQAFSPATRRTICSTHTFPVVARISCGRSSLCMKASFSVMPRMLSSDAWPASPLIVLKPVCPSASAIDASSNTTACSRTRRSSSLSDGPYMRRSRHQRKTSSSIAPADRPVGHSSAAIHNVSASRSAGFSRRKPRYCNISAQCRREVRPQKSYSLRVSSSNPSCSARYEIHRQGLRCDPVRRSRSP